MSDPKALQDDLAAIRALADVLDETGLTEIEIERGTVRLRIAKGGTPVQATYAAPAAPQMHGAAPAASSQAPTPADASHPGAVTSPMVGTCYMAASPGSAPFVKVGDQVNEGQTLLIIEAMKTMNEIKAQKGGRITQIMARDAEPVEFGEVLLIVE